MINFYKYFTSIFLVLCFIISCSNKRNNKTELFYYEIVNKHQNSTFTDSFPKSKISQNNPKDTLLNRFHFVFDSTDYEIFIFSNHYHAVVDGEYLAVWMKDYGTIFSKSMTWNNYSVLRSSDKKTNQLFEKAMETLAFNTLVNPNFPERTKITIDIKN